jgi:TatD DNase family protein
VPSSEAAFAIADGHSTVFPAAGIHPHDARYATPEALDTIERLARDSRCAAVGEIGLDFYRDLSPRDAQLAAFAVQLGVASAAGKPVSVHTRGAEDAAYEPLRAHAARSTLAAQGRAPGVMHCFGGTLEQAQRYVALGYLVSIPCSVMYPNNHEGRRLAANLPLEALVVETDSPYLPPQARRGKRNEPAYVGAAVDAIAELRGMEPVEVAAVTTENALRTFARVEVASR